MCGGLSWDRDGSGAGDQASFLTGHLDPVRIMQGRQRTQMRQLLREDDVVDLLADGHPQVHIGRAAAGGLGGPQGGDNPPAFIHEY